MQRPRKKRTPKIVPCKKCGGTNIQLWECGYSSFNPGGGRCKGCGFEVRGEVGCLPSDANKIRVWNKGQLPTYEERIALLEAENASLRARLERMVEAVSNIRKIDSGAWLKDCSTIMFRCGEGKEERNKLMKALDALYGAALEAAKEERSVKL